MASEEPVRPPPGPPVRLERTLPATTEAADRVLNDIVELLQKSHCWCGDLDEVRLALREALNNAVKHGSRLDPTKQVHVACRFEPDVGLTVNIRDEGDGFDPGGVPDPTAPENLERFSGRGLYMMRELMDEVEFGDGGRSVHMLRRPRPPVEHEEE